MSRDDYNLQMIRALLVAYKYSVLLFSFLTKLEVANSKGIRRLLVFIFTNVCDEFLAGSNLNGLYTITPKEKKYINAGATIYICMTPLAILVANKK